MPSLFPIKKRKYNAGEQEPTPSSSMKKKKETSNDVIDMLSLESSPAASAHRTCSSTSSSGVGEESTLGSSFSPNVASILDTQALTSTSPDLFQTQNSFVVNDVPTTDRPKQYSAVKEKPSFTLTRMTTTTTTKNVKNKREATPRRRSPRQKHSLPAVEYGNADHEEEDASPEHYYLFQKELSPSNVSVTTAIADTPQAQQPPPIVLHSKDEASPALEQTSNVQNHAPEVKASHHAQPSTVDPKSATSNKKTTKKEEASHGSEQTSKVSNATDAKSSSAVQMSAGDSKAATTTTNNKKRKEEKTLQRPKNTSKATTASKVKASAVEKVADECHAQASALDSNTLPEQKKANANNKKRPLQDKATAKSSTTTTPPKSKTKKKDNPKKASISKAAQPVQEVVVETTTRDKENVPASAPQTKPPKNTALPPEDAKPKAKRKKLTFQDQVFQHMMFSYKPFSMKSLAQELKTTEAALNFLMLSLVDKNLVVKKEFTSSNNNKSKELYWVNHDSKAKELQTHLATAAEIQATQIEHDALFQEHAQIQSMLAALMGDGPSNEDLSRQLEEAEAQFQTLQSQLNELKGRIQKMQGGNVKEQNPKRLKQSINHMRDIWKKRREQCNDFIEQLADGMEKKPKEVIKLLELELDGDIQMPPKHKIE